MRGAAHRVAASAIALVISLLTINAVSADSLHHTVEAGETLSGIANEYGIRVEILADVNDIADPNLIHMGDVLDVSGNSPPPTASHAGNYLIEPGDTLSHIALRFATTVDGLKSMNDLKSDLIIAGDSLLVPGDPPAPSAPQPVPTVAVPTSPIELPGERPADPETEATIEELAAAQGVDAGLVKAIAWVESGWDQGARSPSGAVGVMQLMPVTTAWLEADVFGQELNEDVSVYDNIKMGVYLLSLLQQQTGSEELAVTAYYQGIGVTQQGVMYNETRRYVEGVMALRARYWP